MPNLSTIEVKAFVPARDFDLSKRFYFAIGFDMTWETETLARFHAGSTSFLLQNFFVPAHADNFMMHLLVECVDDWHRHLVGEDIAGRLDVRTGMPTDQPWATRDFTLLDPTGVLWRIGQPIPPTDAACGS